MLNIRTEYRPLSGILFKLWDHNIETIRMNKSNLSLNPTCTHTPKKNTTAKQLSPWFKPNKTITLLHHFLPTPPPYTQEKRQRTNIERQNPSFTVFLALHPFRETHHGHFPRCSIVTLQFSWFKSMSFSCFCGLQFLSFMFIYIYAYIIYNIYIYIIL